MDLALFERGVANGELVDEDPQLLQSLMLANGQVHLAHWLRGGMREDPGRARGADPGVRAARDLRATRARADARPWRCARSSSAAPAPPAPTS